MDNYVSSTILPAHETGAVYFQTHAIQIMADILGIQPWSIF